MAVERLSDEGLLARNDRSVAIRWLAELAWCGSERARDDEQTRDHAAQLQWAQIALVMAVAALRDLPLPAVSLDDYIAGIWDC